MERSELIELLEKYTKIEKQEDMYELMVTDEIFDDMDFSPYYLGGTRFACNQFDHCKFNGTKLTYSNYCSNIFRDTTFSKNYITKGNWDNNRFVHCSMDSVETLKVSFFNIIMEDCEVTNSIFTKGIFNVLEEDWLEEEGMGTGRFSKTVFRNCTFDRCSFRDCVYDSVRFIGCTFIDTDIDTTNNGVLFTDCVFRDA